MVVKIENYILILFALVCQTATSQVTGEVNVLDRDIFYLQYNPGTDISDNISYQKFSSRLNFPITTGKKFSIYSSIGLDIHDFEFNDMEHVSNKGSIERFYNVNSSTFLQLKLSKKWSFNVVLSPFLVSNFKDNFSATDANFNGNAFAERISFREKGGYYQFGFGIGYMTLNGKTQVNPIVQLKSRLNDSWSFVLGIPNTYIKWDFHKNQSLKLKGDLNDFYANIDDSILFENDDEGKIVFTTVSLGLEYNLWITSSLGISFKGNYTVWGNYETRNDNDDVMYDFEPTFNEPMIGIGLKFNPIRSLQNGLKPL